MMILSRLTIENEEELEMRRRDSFDVDSFMNGLATLRNLVGDIEDDPDSSGIQTVSSELIELQNQLVEFNMGLIDMVVFRTYRKFSSYTRDLSSIDECKWVAYDAVRRALLSFDAEISSWSTYAATAIERELKRKIWKPLAGPLSVPANLKNGRSRANPDNMSLDNQAYSESDDLIGEMVSGDGSVEKESEKLRSAQIFATAFNGFSNILEQGFSGVKSRRMRIIFERFFINNQSMEEISQVFAELRIGRKDNPSEPISHQAISLMSKELGPLVAKMLIDSLEEAVQQECIDQETSHILIEYIQENAENSSNLRRISHMIANFTQEALEAYL